MVRTSVYVRVVDIYWIIGNSSLADMMHNGVGQWVGEIVGQCITVKIGKNL